MAGRVISTTTTFDTGQDLAADSGAAADASLPAARRATAGMAVISAACRAMLQRHARRARGRELHQSRAAAAGEPQDRVPLSVQRRRRAPDPAEHGRDGRLRPVVRPRPDQPHRHQRAAAAGERHDRAAGPGGVRSGRHADSGAGAQRELPARARVHDQLRSSTATTGRWR